MTITGFWQATSRSRGKGEDTTSVIQRLVVPADIVAVKRPAALVVRKGTPCRQRAEGETVAPGGDRMWFKGRLFVEPHMERARTCCTVSAVVHATLAAALLVLIIMQPDRPIRVGVGQSLVMPAMTAMVPIANVPSPAAPSPERPAPKPRPSKAAEAPAAADTPSAPAPIEAPSSIQPETGFESKGEDGSGTSVPGDGVGGGRPDGAYSVGLPMSGPLRVGGGIQPPRKIKSANPVYPQAALGKQTRGTVVLDATIGIDGKVVDVVVLNSIPLLDQAAIDAVRQWEYEPAMLNGMRVAVIMTILVQFAVQ